MNKYFFYHDRSPLLGLADSQIITFIGGGGKTSLMNTLGKEFASHGYPTLLTTTTHIMKPDFLSDESYIENEDLGQLANIFTNLKKNTLPLAALGIPEKVVNSNVKWRSPSSDFCKKIAEFSKKFSTRWFKKTSYQTTKGWGTRLFSKNRYRNRRNRTFLPRKTNKRNTFSLRTTSESYFFR